MNEYLIGIDIGGTSVRIGHASLDNPYDVLDCDKHSTKSAFELCSDPITPLVIAYASDHEILDSIHAIGVGCPSGFSRDRRTVTASSNIPAFENVPLADNLEAPFSSRGLSTRVYLDSDVYMMMYYDAFARNLVDDEVAVGIYAGTGLGSAVMMKGRLWRGAHGVAGGLGHVSSIGLDDKCTCGRNGCVETQASGIMAAKIANELSVDISELFVTSRNEPAVDKLVDSLSRVTSIYANTLDPNHIVLGGGVFNMHGFPWEKFESHFVSYSLSGDSSILLHTPSDVETGVIGSMLFAASGGRL